jgi:hypothetical protein
MQARRLDIVALDRLGPAIHHPLGRDIERAVQEADEIVLVIAHQGHQLDGSPIRQPVAPQRQDIVDHAGRIRPPVDIVADEDEADRRRRVLGGVGRDLVDQLAQMAAAAMHVADGVEAQAVGQSGRLCGRHRGHGF